MKLLHIFTSFGTAESFFDGQFRFLSNHGYENIVISRNSNKTSDFCERNDTLFIPVYIPRSASPIAITKAIISICHIIHKEKPGAVFGHTPVGALCAMIAAVLCGVKKRIYYRHGLIYTTMSGLKRTIFKTEEKIVSALATEIINVSPSLSRLAVKDGLNRESKQHIIGRGTCGGIDAQKIFNPQHIDYKLQVKLREKLDIEKTSLVFGFCGRICNDKGIPELLDAFELFQEKHPETSPILLLIGGEDDRDGLNHSKRVQMGRNKDIKLTGFVTKDVIPNYYALIDVFIFPSHREGFGMSVLEASAMEKPILVSKSHGCIDSIVEHKTGEYIELSAEGIFRGMELMLNPLTRVRLGSNGRKMVLEWYDTSVIWRYVLDLYRKILVP